MHDYDNIEKFKSKNHEIIKDRAANTVDMMKTQGWWSYIFLY